MEGIAAEVSQKLKSAIKAKLMELGAYVDDELSNYVMVMVTNRRSKAEMDRELQLFLGGNTPAFTSWLQSVWMKLEQVTVTNSGIDNTKRKKKVKKGAKSSSESEDDKKLKKKRKTSASDIAGKEVKKRKSSKVTSTGGAKAELFSEENLSDTPSTDLKSVSTSAAKKIKNPASPIEEDDFLSIKEDFESEFLSDNDSLEAPVKSKPAPVENVTTKKSLLQKSESNEKLVVAEMSADRKHLINRHPKDSAEVTKELSVIRRLTPPDGPISAASSSKIVLKTAGGDKTSEAAVASATTNRKTLIIRDRKPPSRSPSKTPIEVLRSKSRSPAAAAAVAAAAAAAAAAPSLKSIRQRSRSRLRSRSSSASPSPPRTVKRVRGVTGNRDSGSPSRSQSTTRGGLSTIVIQSRSRSPPAIKFASLVGEKKSSTVVDARELINRKRAMVNANEQLSSAKDEKTLVKRPLIVRKHEIVDVDEVGGKHRSAISRLRPLADGGVRLKARERLKENVSVENSEQVEDVDDDDDDDNDDDDDDENQDDDRGDDIQGSANERVNHDDDDAGGSDQNVGDDGANDDDDDDDDDDDNVDGDGYFEQNEKTQVKKKFGPFVVSQEGGTRSVTMRSALEKKSSTAGASKNDKKDLRAIRRTVYSAENSGESAANEELVEDGHVNDDEDDAKSSKDDKVKVRKSKSVMNQIVKYIKEDPPPVNPSSTKPGKISRPKGGNVPAASSTLIRKAMADAHKSMSSSKEESSKKKEPPSNNVLCTNSRISEEKTVTVDQDTSDPGELVLTEETRMSGDEMPVDADIEYNPEDQINHRSDIDVAMEGTEEYDPSKNMPQFVVTLTGLDPKLYPQEDIEMADIDPMMDDIRLKSRSHERCKYYPNCLAGTQCIYYHPFIQCKMFPNCKFGNNCLYVHPKCKYDTSCTRYDCTFVHSSHRILPPVPARHPIASSGMKQPCKYYFSCVNPVCPYQHPKICRYDRFCTNKNCAFSHTSISHVGGSSYAAPQQYSISQFSQDKLRWCRPKENSEIKNDPVEEKTELDAAAVEN